MALMLANGILISSGESMRISLSSGLRSSAVVQKSHATLLPNLISETEITMQSVLAAVRVAPGTTEIREFPMPEIGPDCALLKMVVAGICGTDVKLYRRTPSRAPEIMGHVNIGYIAKAGSEFTRRKG